jgi:hypothetical protein
LTPDQSHTRLKPQSNSLSHQHVGLPEGKG